MHKNVTQIHPCILSELAYYHYQSSEEYRTIKDNYASIKHESTIQNTLSYLNDYIGYSYEEYMALYIIFSLLQKQTNYITPHFLALLDLNIKNHGKVKYIQSLTNHKSYINDITKILTKISKKRNIPSHKLSKHQVRITEILENLTSCYRDTDASPNAKEVFDIYPFFQSMIIPKYLYPSNNGLCYFLASIHSYLFWLHGPQEGKEKLINILHSLTTAMNKKDSEALQYLTAVLPLNTDICLLDLKQPSISLDKMSSEKLYTKNNQFQLTYLHIADLLFTPNFCDGETTFYLLEISQEGGHASSIFRMFEEDPITKQEKTIIYFFEPNYGLIRVTHKEMFIHCLVQMQKKNSLFRLHPTNITDVMKCKSRFNTYIIDILENNIIDNPAVKIHPPTNKDNVILCAHAARKYNTIQEPVSIILALLRALMYQWETIEYIASSDGIVLPPIYVEELQHYLTVQDLHFLFTELEYLRADMPIQHTQEQCITDEMHDFLSLIHIITIKIYSNFKNIEIEICKEERSNSLLHKTIQGLHKTLQFLILYTNIYRGT